MSKIKKYKVNRNIANIFLLILVCITLGFWIGRNTNFFKIQDNYSSGGTDIQSILSANGQGNLFQQVWDTLHQQYYYKNINDQTMYYDAVKGAVSSLGDPVTLFFTPQETSDYNKLISGDSFSGIGVALGYNSQSKVVIEQVLPNTPASKANVAVGYQILDINKQSTANMTIDQVTSNIQGKTGTNVTLTFLNPSNNQNVNITITREPITVASMNVQNLGNGIVDINVTRFTDDTLQDWEQNWDNAVTQALSYNPKGIILDLRGNPGGYFQGAIYAAGSFLTPGSVVAYQQDRNSHKTSFTAEGNQSLANTKTVILVNGGTASAAEILSGALQYYKKAVIVGENTYGKGTAQTIFNFNDGSSLHVTIYHWLLPNGRWIQHTDPIHPDDVIDYSTQQFMQGQDPQMDKAKQLLSQ